MRVHLIYHLHPCILPFKTQLDFLRCNTTPDSSQPRPPLFSEVFSLSGVFYWKWHKELMWQELICSTLGNYSDAMRVLRDIKVFKILSRPQISAVQKKSKIEKSLKVLAVNSLAENLII